MSRDVLTGHALDVAPLLLGAVLESRIGGTRVRVRITETEAYGGVGEDPGSHSFRGPTPRTEVMFGRAGTLYVYFTYGMHWCANLVCGPQGESAAVLLRAAAPVRGLEAMRARRPAARRDAELCQGPARLCVALGIDGSADGADAVRGPLRVVDDGVPPPAEPMTTPRIGITRGTERPWRWVVPGDPHLSRRR